MIDDRVSVRPASPGPTLTLPIRVVYPKDLSVGRRFLLTTPPHLSAKSKKPHRGKTLGLGRSLARPARRLAASLAANNEVPGGIAAAQALPGALRRLQSGAPSNAAETPRSNEELRNRGLGFPAFLTSSFKLRASVPRWLRLRGSTESRPTIERPRSRGDAEVQLAPA